MAKKRHVFMLEPEVFQELQEESQRTGESMSSIVNGLVEQFLFSPANTEEEKRIVANGGKMVDKVALEPDIDWEALDKIRKKNGLPPVKRF